MVVSTFSILDRDGRMRFFKNSFLLANIKLNVIFRMPFLIMNNINVNLKARNLQSRSYITTKVFSTIKKGELIGKKEFAAVTLDSNHEAIVVHIAALDISFDIDNEVHPL